MWESNRIHPAACTTSKLRIRAIARVLSRPLNFNTDSIRSRVLNSMRDGSLTASHPLCDACFKQPCERAPERLLNDRLAQHRMQQRRFHTHFLRECHALVRTRFDVRGTVAPLAPALSRTFLPLAFADAAEHRADSSRLSASQFESFPKFSHVSHQWQPLPVRCS